MFSALAFAACSTSKSDAPASNNTPKISEEAAKAQSAQLPGVVIVRVPVDANGKEVNDKAEMRLVNSSDAVTQSNIAATFDAGKAPATTGDELDQTSSTESFCGWAWGAGFRRRYYGNSYGWNWGYYRPTYLNYGYNYGYNYGGMYSSGCGYSCGGGGYAGGYSSSNYYYYNSGFGNSYSSYGNWNAGMSYSGGMY